MQSLPSVILNADDLLALPIEDLAAILLKIAAGKMQSAGFTYEGVTEITIGSGMAAYRDSGRRAPRPCMELAASSDSSPKRRAGT